MERKMEELGEKLVSSWFHRHSTVPESFVQPPESRPGELLVASGKTIPVIDLLGLDQDTLNLIMKASEEYGFFQVINHGVCEELIEDTLKIFKEFHGMPPQEKMKEVSKDSNGRCKLYASREVSKEGDLQYWRDTLRHSCPPSGQHMHFWPQNPRRYREVVGKYTQEMRRVGVIILELIAKGLGLNSDYFNGELSENPVVLAHHYPPCPEPNLTLGAPKHRDPNLITILLQDNAINSNNALQVYKDGQWIAVEPIPNAFVVNVGLLLQMISNGRLIGAEHRVITNGSSFRTSVAYFINPKEEAVIEPATPLINSTTPPLYSSITYSHFRTHFLTKGTNFQLLPNFQS